MENLISWVEIPATNIKRAIKFYQSILDVKIEQADMFGTKMGFFPGGPGVVAGAIVQGEGQVPSQEGLTVYLNGGNDLQNVLGKVETAGGKVILPKTQISPEHGYMGMFIDTEGNKMAVHSNN